MTNKRSIIIISIFGAVTITVLATALNVKRKVAARKKQQTKSKTEKAQFTKLSYFVLDKGERTLSLDAKELNILNSEDLYFKAPIGVLYNDEQINYKAEKGKYIGKSKELTLIGDVDLKSISGGHKSKKLYYNGSKKYLEAQGDVKSTFLDEKTKDNILVDSNYVNSWIKDKRTLFMGSVKGRVKRRRAYEESFNFYANRVELNQLKSLVSLAENVKLHRNNYHLEAQKAEIFLENFNKKLKYYVLYDDIKLEEKLSMPDGTTQIRRAFSEKLEGYMADAKVVLSGAPRVEQGEDLIKGYQITLRENVELVEVDDSQSSFDLNKDK